QPRSSRHEARSVCSRASRRSSWYAFSVIAAARGYELWQVFYVSGQPWSNAAHVDPRGRTRPERPQPGRQGAQGVLPGPRSDPGRTDAAAPRRGAAPPPDLPARRPARRRARAALPGHRAARPAGVHPLRVADDPQRPEAAAGAVLPGLRRPRRAAADARRGAVAVGLLGAEPPRAQPGLRPPRRGHRLPQPDVEELAALRRAEPERRRRPAPGADLRTAPGRAGAAGAARPRRRPAAGGRPRHP